MPLYDALPSTSSESAIINEPQAASSDIMPATNDAQEQLMQPGLTPGRVEAVSAESVRAGELDAFDEETAEELHVPALDDPHLVDHLREDARKKAWLLRQTNAKMRKITRE